MRAPPGTTTDGITILEEGEGQPEIRYIDRKGADKPDSGSRSGRRTAKKSARAAKRTQKKAARGGKRRRWPWILLAVLLVAGAATGGWGYWYGNVREVTHPVPELIGQNELVVADLLAEGEWTVERTETRQDGTVPGQILAQDPAAGTQLKEGDPVKITVSLGPTLVPLPPDLVGKPIAQAQAELQAAGFSLGEATPRFDEGVAPDVVLDLGPDLLPQMPKGSAVQLIVSAGPAPRTIPPLGGLSVDQARQALEALQLNVATRNEPNDGVPAGTLLRAEPAIRSPGGSGLDGDVGGGGSRNR